MYSISIWAANGYQFNFFEALKTFFGNVAFRQHPRVALKQ